MTIMSIAIPIGDHHPPPLTSNSPPSVLTAQYFHVTVPVSQLRARGICILKSASHDNYPLWNVPQVCSGHITTTSQGFSLSVPDFWSEDGFVGYFGRILSFVI